MVRILMLAIAITGCSGGTPAPADSSQPLTNQPFGAKCTMVSDSSTECTSGVCTDSINQLGIVCSQKCTMLNMTDPSCPNGSMGQKCNMKGYCRP